MTNPQTGDWSPEFELASMSRAITELESTFISDDVVDRIWASGDDRIRERFEVSLDALYPRDSAFQLLEVGCGTGELLRSVEHRFPHAVMMGIDINADAVARARTACQSRVYCNDIEDLDVEPNTFDVIVASEVLEHVPDYHQFLRTCHYLLTSGGVLLLSTPSANMHRTPRRGSGLRHLLSNPQQFARVRWSPHRNWREALPFHPALSSKALYEAIRQAGFGVEASSGVLWLQHSRGALIRHARSRSDHDPILAAWRLRSWINLLDAVLILAPALRLFESRQFVVARKS